MAGLGPMAANIRRLRYGRGLTQDQVAGLAGISRIAFRDIETGKTRHPRVTTLQGIAGALDVGLQELMSEPPQLSTVRFRSHKLKTRKQQALREQIIADVARWLRDFNGLEELLGQRRPYGLDGPADELSSTRSADLPRCAAEHARHALALDPDEPIRNVCALLEAAGVKILTVRSDLEKLFGLSVAAADGGPAVIVNVRDEISVERRIFSAAHELGHLLLHPDAYSADQIEEDEQEERQADRFAGYFLMPPAAFQKEWQANSGLRLVDRVLRVKRIFRVSYKTVLYRLIELGLADKGAWARFGYEYKRQYGEGLGWKEEPKPADEIDVEPLSLARPDFMEGRLSRLVREALDQESISVSRAAEILGVDLQSMRDRIASWEFAA
ncbi:hypothetical protein LCGC14_2245630 [marine sediment metagenome]|uniref:HTH cro/C1-type domain-containing protein n=1 Tax=marine sediment metagenome TaxID=412755 RepID=A0A0F9DRN5_9ZZZZ